MECKNPKKLTSSFQCLLGLFFLSQLLAADVAASGSVISLIIIGGKQAQDPQGLSTSLFHWWSEVP